MTKKEILRKVWLIISWLCVLNITKKFLLGNLDTFSSVIILIFWAMYVLNLILDIVLKVIYKINDYKTYKFLTEGFNGLQVLHKIRYRLYFTGNKKKIEEYSKKIESLGEDILSLGEAFISSNFIGEQHVNSVKEMLKQTKEMMEN